MCRGWASAVGLALVLAVLAACGSDRHGSSTERVPAAEQRDLPAVAYSLIQDLCFRGDSAVDREYAREANARARREFAALERSLREHPDAMVRVQYTPADSPGVEHGDQTVRELAQTHLEGAESPGVPDRARCFERGRARLKTALNEAP